ncbi:MAG: AMP-binding protein [Acidimicrobiales bacterium]
MAEVTDELATQLARGTAIAHWASVAPDRPAVIAPEGVQTFAELNDRVNRLVGALRALGLRAGDAVALMSRNRLEFVEVYAACLRGGWRFTPINFHLTGDEAAYIVGDCQARVLIVDASVPSVTSDATRITFGPEYEARLAAEDGGDIDDPVPGVAMLYTSGTTGRPKGVYRAPPGAVVADLSAYPPGKAYVHLCTGPLYHAAPLAISLHNPISAGATIVLMDQWDAEDTLRLIERHRVTHSHMVATMFHRMLRLPASSRSAYDLSSLRWILHGAAPCPIHVKQAMIEWWGPIIHEYYAATEGGGTAVDAHTWLKHPGTVGKVTPADHVMIGDEEANPVPVGQTGIVWLKSPQSRFEYFGDPAKTSESYRGDYYTLKDVGYVDDEGFLFLTDRNANLIISGGVNIYPAEVDAVLLEHPAVADAATIGVPNDEWGEEVKAVVELRPGSVGSATLAADLLAFCRERLAGYKCPRSVDFADSLPRQDNGKIYKRLLRERYRSNGS